MSNTPILQVKNLHTSFITDAGEVRAVNGISYNLDRGKVLGIVGESGSGKSVSAYSLMRILTDTGRVTEGEVLFNGENILNGQIIICCNPVCHIQGRILFAFFYFAYSSSADSEILGHFRLSYISFNSDIV